MTLPDRICDMCHRLILPPEAIAVLSREETLKVIIHISCLASDLSGSIDAR
jgi:hypothetical protein